MAPIHNAARRGNLHRVKTLLNQGVPVNSRNEGGYTPLHFATYSGPVRVNVAQELLRRGAHVPPNLNAQVRRMLGLPLRRVRPRTGIPAYNNFNINHITVAPRAPSHTPRAVNAPNYSKASKHLKKWLEARPHEIRVNQVNVKLPVGASDPISLKNFNKGNEAIMILKKDVRNGALRTKRYFLEKNVLARLAGKPWRSILHMKASDAVFKDPINRRTVYRRNLMNVKFI